MSKLTLPVRHKAKAVQTQGGLGGTWQAHCECGWTGRKRYATGARHAAINDYLEHQMDMADLEATK